MIKLIETAEKPDFFYLMKDDKPQIIYRWVSHKTLEALVKNVQQFGIADNEVIFEIDDDKLIATYETVEEFLLDHAELLI